MAFQRRVSLALLAALVAASCFSVCVNAAADGALQLPEAAPDRSRVVLVHQARKLTYSDDGEVDIITTIMGDVPVGGGYGYYGYGYSAPPPSVDPTPAPGSPPSPGETPAPSEGPTPTGAPTGEPTSTPEQPTSTPQPTLPPVPANRVGLAFRVNFPTPGGANAILNNPSQLANFRNTFRSQVASSFSSAGVTADDILLGAVTGTGARRSLLQSGIAVDYVMVLPNNTPESVLANIRETSTQNAGNVFPTAFLDSFDLGQPTVQMLEMPGTSSPPPRPPPPPPPGSAARTPVSVAMVALSFFGSSMLLALLW